MDDLDPIHDNSGIGISWKNDGFSSRSIWIEEKLATVDAGVEMEIGDSLHLQWETWVVKIAENVIKVQKMHANGSKCHQIAE